MKYRAKPTDVGWKVEERECESCGKWRTILYMYYQMPDEKQRQLAEAIAEHLNREAS